MMQLPEGRTVPYQSILGNQNKDCTKNCRDKDNGEGDVKLLIAVQGHSIERGGGEIARRGGGEDEDPRYFRSNKVFRVTQMKEEGSGNQIPCRVTGS